MNNDILVSVVVITYNSANYVIETLDSIYEQTYDNLELIISDDGSKDETVDICKKWVNEHCSRFVRVEILTVESNTGVPANCNRGYRTARGLWVKYIAGDDALLPTCIEDNIRYVQNNPQARICHSEIIEYKDTLSETNIIRRHSKQKNELVDNNCSIEMQLTNLMLSSCINACSLFVRKDLYDKVGGFDETIKLSEDWPFYIKIVMHGEKIYFMDKETVKYRRNSYSIFMGSFNGYVFPNFYKTEKQIYKLWIKPMAPPAIRIYWRYYFLIRDVFVLLHLNKKNFITSKLFGISYRLESRAKKIIKKSLNKVEKRVP